MMDDFPDRPTIQLEDNILVEVEYLTDQGESSTNHNEDDDDDDDGDNDDDDDDYENGEEEGSDWDASTLSIVPTYTPQRGESTNTTREYSGFSPLQRVSSNATVTRAGTESPSRTRTRTQASDRLRGQGTKPSARNATTNNTASFLASFQSPPEVKPKRPQFESYGVDNRTRTPHYPVTEPVSVDAFMDDDEEEESSLESRDQWPPAMNMNYGASKYLHSSRPSLSSSMISQPPHQQSSFRQARVSLQSPANRSVSSMQSASSLNPRRYSMMSHRSSTSMSLLFGEVINLEDRSRFTAMSGDTDAAQSPMPASTIDLEGGGLEGLEIGGGPWNGTTPRVLDNDDDTQGRRGPLVALGIPVETLSKSFKQVKLIGQTATRGIQTVASKTRYATQKVIHSYRPPLSPHARALEDLEYLQQTHKQKVWKLSEHSAMEDHYDFVLLLKPQEVYRFWAEILDFRVEHLGDELMAAMEPQVVETASTNSTHSRESAAEDYPDEREPLYSTPQTGIRRRAKTPNTKDRTPMSPRSMARASVSNALFSPTATTMPLSQSLTTSKRMTQRMSMFEKAIGIVSSPVTAAGGVDESFTGTETPVLEPRSAVRRRWGNHAISTTKGASTANLTSPPIRSLTRGVSSVRKVRVSQTGAGKSHGVKGDKQEAEEDEENVNPNRLKSAEDLPNPIIPRGIAARTNGMLPFLSALKRGIVVRRHRSGKEAVYCKIFSRDGGDTIQYQLVDATEAMVAFKEQRVRHNRHLSHGSSPTAVRAHCQEWAFSDGTDDGSLIHKFNVPDHVAAHRYREKLTKDRLKMRLVDIATKAANSGIIRAADLVAVHPASHADPRHPGVRQGALGTASLRKSKSEYYTSHTFSIVVSTGQRFGPNNNKNGKKTKSSKSDPNDNKWYGGEGNELQFKTLDFEAASEGEYWLIFRGFLLLQRDVVVGRFAAERRAGIGGGNHNSRNSDGDNGGGDDNNNDELENQLHRDEFLEPVTVGSLERAYVNLRKLDKTYMEGAIAPTAVPPPSDYFLGFRSPGTQIWSRLRLAGLETTRIYAVDTRRVMIKIRCPEDRLTDVAEVLRIKMKTHDGNYAAFREDTANHFRPLEDPLDVPPIYQGQVASLLRSKDRQNIIDFIIGSRIRDSGAELGPTTDVGKMVQARIPLHMNDKLESLFRPWVYYWKKENWTSRPSKKAEEEVVKGLMYDEESGAKSNGSSSSQNATPEDEEIPNFPTRFLIGAFHQPLDAIEEYFGEKVTFYFAWLQHCSCHLLVLTVFGLIVTICQLYTNNFDHPIRPLFAMVVMIWTFMVLLNWRKRSNLLAYKWGSMDYKVQETPRPEFHGEYVVDEITKEWIVTYPQWKRWLKYCISVPITCFFTGMAVLLILMVHANRDLQMESYVEQLTNPAAEPFRFEFSMDNIGKKAKIVEIHMTREMLFDPTFWAVMGGLPAFLGLCIPIMNLILMKISVMLNNFENYRTESEYRTHLIIKVFSFRFVSQLGTLYYYAVISMGDAQSIENGMIRMATSVMVYTTVAHWWSIFLQVYIFMFIRNIRRTLYRRKLRQELQEVELEEESLSHALSDAEAQQIRIINKRMLLDQAQDDVWFELMNPPHDSFPEYITAVVQFSFVACFSVVLPITPLFCLFNYLISMRYDAYKLCRGRRRPLAQKTGGIGIWEHLLHIVAVIAVLTNCWLIAFTAADFSWIEEEYGEIGLFAIVVGWEHTMLLIKYVMQTTMSPLPKVVRDELKRKQHALDKERYSTMRTKDLGRRGKTEKPSSGARSKASESFDENEFRRSLGLALTTTSPATHALNTITSFESVSDTDTMSV